MILMCFEQEQSWDVASQSLTSSTNSPEKVTSLFISPNLLRFTEILPQPERKSFMVMLLSTFSLFALLLTVISLGFMYSLSFSPLCYMQPSQVSHICLTLFVVVVWPDVEHKIRPHRSWSGPENWSEKNWRQKICFCELHWNDHFSHDFQNCLTHDSAVGDFFISTQELYFLWWRTFQI